MSSAKSLLQNAAVYSFSNILNAAIPFLLLPILTRVLLPADYGVIAMFNATLGVLGAFTGLSVHGAVNVRFIDRESIDFPRYVGSCLCVLLLSTLATLVVVALFMKPLSDFTAVPPIWLIWAVLASGFNFLIQVRLGIWLMAKKPLAYGTFQVLLSLLNVSLSLGFVILLRQGYEGRLLGQIIALALFALIALFSLSRGKWVAFRPSIPYMREALAFGVPLVPHVIGGVLLGLADRFIINKALGLEAAGIYMVAAQIGMGIGLLADAFNKSFVPWLYEQLKSGGQAAMQRIVRGSWLYFGIALGSASVVAILSYWIVSIVAGPKYIDAAEVLAWLAFGQAFNGMYLMVTNYIFYARKTKILPWVTLFSGCAGLALTWVVVPVYGIIGAGASFAIAMFLRFLLTWALSHRIWPMPWFSFWGTSRL
ncbi:lipopolysaccharide biosynthesis protein [Geopsychrobacter electrodiphilus]|uniref:lipopolysaccharide biosynthesis protein n=1 Tax=Geopsychrobacter electrodiphilus TaxID=225196 RepID=UPI000373FAA7|nr:oligosaccharide flippase family protein [Geopsychrobacter electrodiphilus]